MAEYTEVEEKVLTLLKRGPQSCTDIGSALWGTDFRKPQAYARPAGKVLAGLKRAGRVEQVLQRRRFVYILKVGHG